MPDPISWSHSGPYLLAALIAGYLLGSIPFGLLLTRAFGAGDLRRIGSGNIGATNVLRTGRKGLAAATLLFDAGKGVVAVLVAQNWGPDTAIMAALGAVLGHLFPVWLKFRGGKGVATALGVILALSWPVCIACCFTWLVTAAVSRYSSVSSLTTLAASPLLAWWLTSDGQLVQFLAILAVLIWFRHHENIRRLLKGEESKIGQKKAES